MLGPVGGGGGASPARPAAEGMLSGKAHCPRSSLSVGFFSFERGNHFGEKDNKLESIFCLVFEGPNDAFFSSR